MSEKGAPFDEILPAMQEHIDAEVKRVMLNVSTEPKEVVLDSVKEYAVDMSQPPEPHRYVKYSDCCFVYEDGPDPATAEVESLRAQVRFLQDMLEAANKLIAQNENEDIWHAAYQRMRENFQVSLNTIRGLEDLLHSTQRELEETKEQVRAARAAMRIA